MKLLDIIVLKKEDVILSVCDTKVLFDGIKDSLLFLEQKYGVSIIFSVESALVWAEPTLLLSLVYNLADNACKASTEGETVKITGKKEAGQYSVSVIDHGRGILKENLEHLTDPFFMEDKSRSRKQGGAGLGFYMAKGFFDMIPRTIDEAAYIDGATKWDTFLHITIPMSKPIITYTLITAFMGPWVDYIFAKVIMGNDTKYYTIAIGLWTMLEKEYVETFYTQFYAGCVIISIPLCILFLLTQKCYVEGVSGAVKG